MSLASNAIVDHLLGDTIEPIRGTLGVLLVFVGVTLCTLPQAQQAAQQAQQTAQQEL